MHGIPRYRTFNGPAIFRQGFRPFFLGAGIWAVLSIAIWIAVFRGDVSLQSVFAPMRWHVHEMLFGFAAAAVAGFLLTAIPNWTGRLPLQGVPLIVLFGVWLLGRIAMASSAVIGGVLAAIVDVSFLALLFAVVCREIVAGRNWRNLPVLAAVAVLIAANTLTQLDANGLVQSGRLGERLGLSTFVLLISLIGGRIVPSFTRNWLAKNGGGVMPTPFNRFDMGVLLVALAGLVLWVVGPSSPLTGAVLVVAGLASFVRLGRWCGWRAFSEPLLWSLHLGYAWVAAGLVVLGASVLLPAMVPYPAGIHALGTGAIGTMALAVMTRAIRGHTGRPLETDTVTTAIYALITLAAILRVTAPFTPSLGIELIVASGIVWIAAFSLFAGQYGYWVLTD
ncbi:MAG: NnrS family protein [Methyloceanibacter sp.]|uniref:NnrS family protein n=1 Tax=Methyloceanibacter sp. TaxID=1965321 RepID=UPI001DC0198E|nr:NnrS family protein [Methyloceanibacter sp.]MCB1444042.1 NnrS family protein [Methyloceanibacter sp.]